MKIINASDKPYDVVFDSMTLAVLQPKQVGEFENAVALHAIRHSEILDAAGEIIGYRLKPLSEVPKDERAAILLFECPYRDIEGCTETFSGQDKLRAHLELHWATQPEAGGGTSNPPSRAASRR